jgi:7-carboxy-7-deazaguanine synthase
MDIKCPSSGFSYKTILANIKFLKRKDQIKFVIADKKDLKYAQNIIKKHNLIARVNVILTPVGGIDCRWIIDEILKAKLDVRIGLQVHKIVFGANKGGI